MSHPAEYLAVVGSRTFSNETVVHATVKRLLANGYGIASGGSAGVDHLALTALLKFNPCAGKIFTVGDRHAVNPQEVDPLLVLVKRGGILQVGPIRGPERASRAAYVQALLKRSDEMVLDPSVKGIIAFLDLEAESSGTWHTVEAAIFRGKRAVVYTADAKALREFPGGYWRRVRYNPRFYLWVPAYFQPLLAFENGQLTETIERHLGAPALAAREGSRQDQELLASTGLEARKTVGGMADYAFPLRSQLPREIRSRWTRKISPDLPPDDKLSTYTVEVSSLEEGIEQAGPDQAPLFSNPLDRLIWEEHMSSHATQAYREDIAQPKSHRQLPYIMAQTGVTLVQAQELRRYWDAIGGTSELYRFYFGEFREIRQTAQALGFAGDRLNEMAIGYYRHLAEELEEVTRVPETDMMEALDQVQGRLWERAYTRDDLLGFDRPDDYEKETALGSNGREIEVGQLPDDAFAEEAEVTPDALAGDEDEEIRSWIPLGEAENLDVAAPDWFRQQPRQYIKLLDAIEEVTPADLPALGKELYAKARGFTKAQRIVAFEAYARAKEKALAWTEKHLNADALKVKRAILKAGTRREIAQLGQRIHKGQKEGRAQIDPREWTILWRVYGQKKALA